jgi:hypothetical protein
MAWSVGFEVPKTVRWRVALRDVLRVAVRVALRAASRPARDVVIAGIAAGYGVAPLVTSLCRRSSRGGWMLGGVRCPAARGALARSPIVSVLAGSACGLVASLLGVGGDVR